MHWKVTSADEQLKGEHEFLSDPGLSDGAARTLSWLLTKVDAEKAEVAAHAARRRVTMSRIHQDLVELERKGLLVVNETAGVVEVRIQGTGDARDRDSIETVLVGAREKHRKDAETIRERRATSPNRLPTGRKFEKRVGITCDTVRRRWSDSWEAAFPGVKRITWGKRELAMANQLIERLGPEDAVRYVEMVIAGWAKEVVTRYPVRGYPSLEWVVKNAGTVGLELLSGTKVGRDASGADARRALRKGEFDEHAASREEDVGWGDG